ncbi:DUF1722 domain-containing protein [Clostridium saccharoperbutylacetonicum]|uniref:DUF1722 domain-containing protein n=1 Tax=Clostridium saccharoperbutylacetonicum TaxID=36745 RepID=UPI000348D267|nr:DUF1722 domain-containing protein [Clostridium saccharoperbutylacetonicum]
MKNVDKYEQGKISIKVIKNMLRKLAFKYKEYYLLDSYYFFYLNYYYYYYYWY